MTTSLQVVAFDLDDTLTVSKSKIDPRMARLLEQLLTRLDVCIISGGRFEQFETQVLRYIDAPAEHLARLHILPTNGTRYYTWHDAGWQLNYAEDLKESEKTRIIAALTEGAKELGLWETNTWGDIIEDRGSQITYSALGQAAPPEEKYKWDPNGSKKRSLRDYAARILTGLEVRAGGSTSVDVTRKGIDKAYGIRKLLDRLDIAAEQVLFLGDRLDEAGNDYPVIAVGVRTVAVTRWQETADYIEGFLKEL